MGGFHKTLGRVYRPIRTIIDPLNIMDPFRILPGSSAGLTNKPFSFDPNFGGPLRKLFAGGGGGSASEMSSQYDPAMMMYFSQIQAQQAQQAEQARKAQEEALAQAQQQTALSTAKQGETAAQQSLLGAGAMVQAKDIAAQEQQQKESAAAGTSAIGPGYDITKARQEQIANLTSQGITPGSLPFYGYDSANTGVGGTGRPVNVFNLPKTTGITFGGQ